jgi:chemotaxis protein CheX
MTQTLHLDPILDMRASAPLKAALVERRGQPIVIDASGVQRLGGLCLQVLLAARRTWMEDHMALSIEPRSDAFAAALRLFGAETHFDESSLTGGVH